MRALAALTAAALAALLPGAASHGKSAAKNSTLFRGDEFQRGRRDKTLYGADNRLEESQVTDAAVLATGAATAALVRASDLTFNQNTRTWARRYTCETEKKASSASIRLFRLAAHTDVPALALALLALCAPPVSLECHCEAERRVCLLQGRWTTRARRMAARSARASGTGLSRAWPRAPAR